MLTWSFVHDLYYKVHFCLVGGIQLNTSSKAFNGHGFSFWLAEIASCSFVGQSFCTSMEVPWLGCIIIGRQCCSLVLVFLDCCGLLLMIIYHQSLGWLTWIWMHSVRLACFIINGEEVCIAFLVRSISDSFICWCPCPRLGGFFLLTGGFLYAKFHYSSTILFLVSLNWIMWHIFMRQIHLADLVDAEFGGLVNV